MADLTVRAALSIGIACVLAAGALASGFDPAVPDSARIPAIIERNDAFMADAILGRAIAASRLKSTAEMTGYDLISIDSDTVLDLAAGEIESRTDVVVESLVDGLAGAQFWLDSLDSIAIESGGSPLDFTDTHGGMVEVTFDGPLDEGERLTISFYVDGAPECEPGFFGMMFCNIDEDLTYFGGAPWVPTKVAYNGDDLMDFADVAFALTVPSGYVAAGSARLVEVVDNGNGTETHVFESIEPIGDVSFAVAPFDVATATGASGVVSQVLTLPGHDAYGQGWADTDADIVDFYEARYCDYPYGKIDSIQVLQELYGGFATPAAVFVLASAFDNQPAVDWMAESIFAHEIGHQWWAYIVPTYEYESPWLTEGFAEFSAYTYSAEIWTQDYIDYVYDYEAQLVQYYVETEEPLSGMDTGRLSDDAYFLLTYQKGAWVLRMLRAVLGDEAFYAGMRTWAEGAGRDGTSTDGFRAEMEAASGEDLAWFFDQWAEGTGWPHYKTGFTRSEDETAVSVTVTQEQDELFDMPVQIAYWVGDAEDDDPEMIVVTERIDQRTQTFDYEADEPIRGVRLDPRALVMARRETEPAGDIGGDGRVDGIDLLYLAYATGSDIFENSQNWIGEMDLDFDGYINEADRSILEANFGREEGDE